MSILHDLLAERGYLLVDGAMGTELFDRGLESGDSPERWNLEEQDRVASVHQAYVDSGSDIFLTNTFGGTSFRLALHKMEDQVFEINQAAAQIARRVADGADRKVLVAGSLGPTGELLDPMGSMTMETCQAAFAAQAEGLEAGGVDLAWIETMSSLDELRAAVAGVRQTTSLPICMTMSFDTAGRSMMGVTGTELGQLAQELDVVAVGANCGNNLADTEAALQEMQDTNPDLILISKANAGMPEWRGADLHYSGSPEIMAAQAHRVRAAGVAIVGACCGSSPAHIAMMRDVLDGTLDPPEVDVEVAATRFVAKKRTSRRRSRG